MGFGRFGSRLAVMAGLTAAAWPALAATAWDEDLAGELSDDRLSPTPLHFVAGANGVLGTIGSADRDFFTFVVPAGMSLSAINVMPGTSVSGSASFIAIEAGDKITTTPSGANIGDLLSFNHYGNDAVGHNLLGTVLLLPADASTLASGTYSVWLNETGGTVPYNFEFVLTAVPEPSAALLLAAGLLTLRLRRRA